VTIVVVGDIAAFFRRILPKSVRVSSNVWCVFNSGVGVDIGGVAVGVVTIAIATLVGFALLSLLEFFLANFDFTSNQVVHFGALFAPTIVF
jgi:hypothetical protein